MDSQAQDINTIKYALGVILILLAAGLVLWSITHMRAEDEKIQNVARHCVQLYSHSAEEMIACTKRNTR